MDLEQLITQYQPSDSTRQLIRDTRIALLVGISGAGKSTIKQQLLEKPDYSEIISHTTRSPRVDNGVAEIPDVNYYFINQDLARGMLAKQQFIEAKFVHGVIYGTSVAELQKVHDENKIALADLDIQGADEYAKISEEVKAIFILPPNYEVWRQRFQKRYKTSEEFEAEWPKRRASAIKELTHALEVPYYHFVINDELIASVEAANKIICWTKSTDKQDTSIRRLVEILLRRIKTSD
jgi:guanylate kinase